MTLIELIVFIVIVSTALAGVLTVLNITAKSSADPMIRKQMLAVAEAILEEVMSQPFTYCAPTDANAATATSATTPAGCATTVQGLGAGGSARIASSDNVGDYANVALNPVTTITGTSFPGYSATIAEVPESLGPAAATIASSACASASDCSTLNVLRISVTVSHAGADNIVLEGYRTRYSPNFTP
jgi:MSHA pilin protein MshD